MFCYINIVSTIVYSQNQQTPILFDEFGAIQCGDLQARTDAFIVELNNRKDFVGLVIIYPELNSPRDGSSYYRILISNMHLRRFDDKRVSIVAGEAGKELRAQFWIYPKDGDRPEIDATKWPVPAIDRTKPLLFGSENESMVCPTFVPRLYAEFLLDNPETIGRIEIFGPDKNSRQSFSEMYIEELVDKYRVPRDRIEVVFKRKKGITYGNFWVVPQGKK